MGWSCVRIVALGFTVAVIASAPAPGSAEATAPTITKTAEGYAVALPEAMRHALDAYDPSFTIFPLETVREALGSSYEYSSRQMPFALVGDFNGDAAQDVALSGYTKMGERVVLAILSQEGGFKVVEVERCSDSSSLGPVLTAMGCGRGVEAGMTHVTSTTVVKVASFSAGGRPRRAREKRS